MESGTDIKLISKSKTITSSYVVNISRTRYPVLTTVTNDPKEVMSRLIQFEQWTGENVIGMEVQYCRHSSKSSKKPAILTLCGFNARLLLIIQLSRMGKIPDQLRNLFSNKRCKFVGANVVRSVAMLKEEYGIIVDRYEDISKIAGGRPINEFLYKLLFMFIVAQLMMEHMIMRKRPEIEDAVWEKEELDDDLVALTTLESYLSYLIGLGSDSHWSRH